MKNISWSGEELKKRRDNLRRVGVGDSHISVISRVSITTLHKIYRGHPTILPNTLSRVVEAIGLLESENKASA